MGGALEDFAMKGSIGRRCDFGPEVHVSAAGIYQKILLGIQLVQKKYRES
jgi:hypothetical protein